MSCRKRRLPSADSGAMRGCGARKRGRGDKGPLEFCERPRYFGERYGWLGDCPLTCMVAQWCERNDVERLRTFFSSPDVANKCLQTECINNHTVYPFRLFSRLLLRAIDAHQTELADILVAHLAVSRHWSAVEPAVQPTVESAVQTDGQPGVTFDLFRRLAKLLFTRFSDDYLQPFILNWIHAFRPPVDSNKVGGGWCEARWEDFWRLVSNEGGDNGVWWNVRPSMRTMIAHRLFSPNKSELNETYASFFSETSYGCDTIRIMARECRIFISKSQLSKSVYIGTRHLPNTVLTAVLLSWGELTKPGLKEVCRFDSVDLQRLLFIIDPEIRRERLDIVTTAGPKISIHAEELQRFHLSGFSDRENPVPWIHASIFVHRSAPYDWMSNHVTAFYLQRQGTLREAALESIKNAIDQTVWSLPSELVQIISDFLITRIEQLVEIDRISIQPHEHQIFQRLCTNPKPKYRRSPTKEKPHTFQDAKMVESQ